MSERRERDRALDLAITQIEKLYGKGSIMRLGTAGALESIGAIPTGSLELDHALGIGGVP
ncbi:MAG: DNA recombination/repair protein RecA, partial [Candidatus Methylomirabilales bacterium]